MNKKTILAALLLGIAADAAASIRVFRTISTTSPSINKTQKKSDFKVTRKRVKPSKYKTMAGKRSARTRILYNSQGYPIFERVCACDLKLSKKIAHTKDINLHFREATKILKNKIAEGEIDPARFRPSQLQAILKGNAIIPGYAWHHHQQFGRMQLVPERIHANTPHDIGFSLWYN